MRNTEANNSSGGDPLDPMPLSASTRRFLLLCAGGTVALLTFTLTPRVLDWLDGPPYASTVFKASDLNSLASFERTVGLAKSATLGATLDTVQRRASGEIDIAGWAVDQNPAGNPVTLYLFWNARPVIALRPHGPRPDVANALQLGPEMSANLLVTGKTAKIDCYSDPALVVVVNRALNAYRAYQVPVAGCQ